MEHQTKQEPSNTTLISLQELEQSAYICATPSLI